ncbi:MAG: tRNA pseudouridine synthase A, partial [candidate division Zixibacteria bacterium]|nr:tRNA pseudouridine synthase A [candidate division Zixibacteria bacterium]
ITEAIKKITGQDVRLIGAGRTDAGVHALGQVANFHIDHHLPIEKYRAALNHHLDDDIVIREALEVPLEFHARFDARRRRYRYLLGTKRSALYRHQRWDHPHLMDSSLLNQAAAMIVGEHDFSPFCVTSSLKEDNRCTIEYSRWFFWGDLMIYEVRGNRFLHHMVRGLVATMVNLARVKPDDNKQNLTLDAFEDIMENASCDRVVFTAPAAGLYLVSVGYDEGKA